MECFSVKILFQFIVEGLPYKFYEESIRLFHAESFDDALEKAESFAEKNNRRYTNIYGRKVEFKLYKVVEAFVIYDNVSFTDSSEVFSAIFKAAPSDNEPTEKSLIRCSAEDMYVLRME